MMKIIPSPSEIKYSQNKVRYARDAARDENDLSKKNTPTRIEATYFCYNYKRNRTTEVLVRIGSKVASLFGAKTISQNNLSNCLRKANAYFANKYQFTVSQLLEARKTLLEIKDKKNFGKYLESNKGNHDNDRIKRLSSHINNQLEQKLLPDIKSLGKKIMTDLHKRFPNKKDFGLDDTIPAYHEYVKNLTTKSKEKLLVETAFLSDIYLNEQYKLKDTEKIHGFVITMKHVLKDSMEDLLYKDFK